MITMDDATTYADMVGKALQAKDTIKCIQEAQGIHIAGGAIALPTFGYGRGGSDSTTNQKRKVSSASGGSTQKKKREFLSKYATSIDCKRKMKARELLQEGCLGFLAVVLDATRPKLAQPKDIKVVQEFLDVFPEEFSGLPQQQKIDFVIDFAHGVEHVSIAPYRMALAKLKEIKIQL
uniref:Uncharacterized protein n=1 Tax=Cannabis sativa TaxID=3483 RepID=A0A803QI74_CANSA